MLYSLLANLLLIVHLGFVVFVVIGGVGWLRWRWWPWTHLPVAAYGIAIEWVGWTCPLTPLESSLRRAAGQQGYDGGFIEHYLLKLIYPGPITPTIGLILGSLVLATNLAIYCWIWHRRSRRQ